MPSAGRTDAGRGRPRRVRRTWPTTSQSNSQRMAARCCLISSTPRPAPLAAGDGRPTSERWSLVAGGGCGQPRLSRDRRPRRRHVGPRIGGTGDELTSLAGRRTRPPSWRASCPGYRCRNGKTSADGPWSTMVARFIPSPPRLQFMSRPLCRRHKGSACAPSRRSTPLKTPLDVNPPTTTTPELHGDVLTRPSHLHRVSHS